VPFKETVAFAKMPVEIVPLKLSTKLVQISLLMAEGRLTPEPGMGEALSPDAVPC
jgi:hypothetical protein